MGVREITKDIKEILVMPPELELINIYHKMYSLDHVSEYDTLAELETKLFVQLHNRRKEIEGGGAVPVSTLRPDVLNKIILKAIRQFLQNSAIVLTGEYGFIQYDTIPNNLNLNQLRIITSVEIEMLTTILKDILNDFMLSPDIFKISVVQHKIHLPYDQRLHMYRIYLEYLNQGGKVNKQRIMTVFNSALYEVIPYKSIQGINVSSELTSLRIMLIELWVLRVMKEKGFMDATLANKYINALLDTTIKFRETLLMDNKIVTKYNTSFIGVYIPLAIAKKIEKGGGKKRGKTLWKYF
jgi:hypothetical protein